MIKAVFFDMDGTLLSHQSGDVPTSTKAALMNLKQCGIKIFAATGRHMMELKELAVDDLPFDGFVTLNGQICLNETKELLYDSPIDYADVKTMVTCFEQQDIPIMIIESNNMYINFVNQAVRDAQKAISTAVPPCANYHGDKVYQFIVFDKKTQVQHLINQLTSCKINEWNAYAFDVIPQKGGKVTGIKEMLKHYHIKQNEIMAFGDGDNDIDMLQYASIGVAMGNADKDVQKHADYVTDGVNHDGIVHALQYFKLI